MDDGNIGLSIYPNPASDKVTLKFVNNTGKAVVNIYDMAGRNMESITVNAETDHITIDTNRLNSGIYFITLTTNGAVVAKEKLVVLP